MVGTKSSFVSSSEARRARAVEGASESSARSRSFLLGSFVGHDSCTTPARFPLQHAPPRLRDARTNDHGDDDDKWWKDKAAAGRHRRRHRRRGLRSRHMDQEQEGRRIVGSWSTCPEPRMAASSRTASSFRRGVAVSVFCRFSHRRGGNDVEASAFRARADANRRAARTPCSRRTCPAVGSSGHRRVIREGARKFETRHRLGLHENQISRRRCHPPSPCAFFRALSSRAPRALRPAFGARRPPSPSSRVPPPHAPPRTRRGPTGSSSPPR